MKRKFITFLALASLAQSFAKLPITYDLLEEDLPNLSEIIANQEASMTAYFEGIEPVFKKLEKLTIKLSFKMESQTDDCSSTLDKALAKMKIGVDLFLDSVLLVVGKSCHAVEVARRKSHDNLKDAFATIGTAVKLALSGNGHQNQVAIEEHRVAVRKDFTNLVESVYDPICTCMDIKEADILAVIKSAQNESRIGLVHLTNAVFNAIKVCGAAAADKCADVTLIPNIKDCRDKGIFGLQSNAEHKFSAIRALYIYFYVNIHGIVTSVAANQYAQIVSDHRYKEGNDVLFEPVSYFLRRIALGLCNGDKDDFSPIDATALKVIALYVAGDGSFFTSMRVRNPNSISAIDEAQKALTAFDVIGVNVFFDAINKAANKSQNYNETLALIAYYRNASDLAAPEYSRLEFDLISNNKSYSDEIEAKLKICLDTIVYGAKLTTNRFFDAVTILARATHECKVRENDLCDVEALGIEANHGMDYYTQPLSVAGLIVMKADAAAFDQQPKPTRSSIKPSVHNSRDGVWL